MIHMIMMRMRRIWCFWLQEYWRAYSSLKCEKAQLAKR